MVPWSPSVSGVLYTTIARSDTSNPLGLGHSNYGAQLAVNAWATEYLNTAVALGRPLSANSGNAAMDLEVALALHRTPATLGFSSELGRADSGAVLARSLAGGVAVSVAGPLTLTVDASHGLTTGAPRWTLSVGLGTAFGGVSPLSPSSPLRRLKKTLGAKVAGTSGYSKSSSGSTSCKKVGTC